MSIISPSIIGAIAPFYGINPSHVALELAKYFSQTFFSPHSTNMIGHQIALMPIGVLYAAAVVITILAICVIYKVYISRKTAKFNLELDDAFNKNTDLIENHSYLKEQIREAYLNNDTELTLECEGSLPSLNIEIQKNKELASFLSKITSLRLSNVIEEGSSLKGLTSQVESFSMVSAMTNLERLTLTQEQEQGNDRTIVKVICMPEVDNSGNGKDNRDISVTHQMSRVPNTESDPIIDGYGHFCLSESDVSTAMGTSMGPVLERLTTLHLKNFSQETRLADVMSLKWVKAMKNLERVTLSMELGPQVGSSRFKSIIVKETRKLSKTA